MITETIYKEYKSNLLKGDRIECTKITKNLLSENTPVKNIYLGLFQRSLYEVGSLWETNKISVAVEHICTSITEGLITLTYPQIFASEHTGKSVVVTCTPGENHQVGARLVADYFELNGWNSFFVGSNTPYFTLEDYITKNIPDLLAVSMSLSIHLQSIHELLTNVTRQFPELQIILGGQGFNDSDAILFKNMKNVRIIKTLNELDTKILNVRNNEHQVQ